MPPKHPAPSAGEPTDPPRGVRPTATGRHAPAAPDPHEARGVPRIAPRAGPVKAARIPPTWDELVARAEPARQKLRATVKSAQLLRHLLDGPPLPPDEDDPSDSLFW